MRWARVKRMDRVRHGSKMMDIRERVKLKACQAAVPIVWGFAPGIVCRAANHILDNCYCTILSALMPLSSCANWSRRTEASRRRITCPVRSSGRPALRTATCCHLQAGAAQHVDSRQYQGPRQAVEAFLGISCPARASAKGPEAKDLAEHPQRPLRLEQTSRLALADDTTAGGREKPTCV